MAEVVRLACQCGGVSGALSPSHASYGHRAICHCRDCRAFARWLGAEAAVLDENGATEIYQTIPGRLRVTQGGDQIACMRLSPKGLMRWYASCCNTPLGNTLPSAGFGFVGIPMVALPGAGPLGRLICSVHAKHAPEGASPPKDHGFAAAGMRILARHLATKLRLAPAGSPFFPGGEPLAPARVLTLAERQAVSAP